MHAIANSQECSCVQEFSFVRQHMEKNHPGFSSDIKDPQQPAYKAFVQSLEQKMLQDASGKYCVAFLKQYMFYLKDHHISINSTFKPVKEDSIPAVEAFFRTKEFLSTERIDKDSALLVAYLQQPAESTIEGIYKTPDGTYTVALIKDKTSIRDYVGIILDSKTKLWQKGQVKMEVKQLTDSTFEIYSLLRNHSLDYNQFKSSKESFELPGWIRVNAAVASTALLPVSTELFTFKVLDSNTAYIAIRSFGGQFSQKLDSAYKAVMPELTKRRNLIIDIRNNGGGSDVNYKALMPLLYTGPIVNDVVELFSTPDNIQAYTAMRDLYKSQPAVYGEKGYMIWEYNLPKLQNAKPYTFTPMGDGRPSTAVYTPVKGYPAKVAILYNRNCASSCESFLFEAQYSKKTITAGENSGGYTGYGNVMSVQTPCGNTLNWTTTRYRYHRQYDFTGIPPQYHVPANENDWIKYVRSLLESSK
jgi:hypothetical protein